ncbi:hypothetical protein SAMN05443637_13243, partial [Pseudonocardia thermophila]
MVRTPAAPPGDATPRVAGHSPLGKDSIASKGTEQEELVAEYSLPDLP